MKTVPLLLVVLIAIVGQGSASSDKNLYPYGQEQGDKTNTITVNGCSRPQRLQEEFVYFGKSFDTLYVCNKGVISFNTPIQQFTLDAHTKTGGKAFLTPFSGEMNNIPGEEVYYRETQDRAVLERVTNDINKHVPNIDYKAAWAFITTWEIKSYYGSSSQRRKTFQAVLNTDRHRSYVILNYDSTQWTDVDDDTPAQARSNSGYHTHYFSPPGPKTNKVLNITSTSNVNNPGLWLIQADDFKVPGGCIFEAKFAKEGEPFWKESTCSTKCLCQDYEVTCVSKACPPSSTCKELGSFFTCNKKPE